MWSKSKHKVACYKNKPKRSKINAKFRWKIDSIILQRMTITQMQTFLLENIFTLKQRINIPSSKQIDNYKQYQERKQRLCGDNFSSTLQVL